MATSLPNNPSLERFRRDARRLQRAVRLGVPHAVIAGRALPPRRYARRPVRLHPHRRAAGRRPRLRVRQLAEAQALPRASRPSCAATRSTRTPATTSSASATSPACSTRRRTTPPDGTRRRTSWPPNRICPRGASTPPRSWATTRSCGSTSTPTRQPRPVTAARSAGCRWCTSSTPAFPQRDAVATARLLLDAGADPASGYLWQGLPTPFTALTGCFGEGEQGPGRQPRHPQWEPLARLLLDRGADPNDGQTLYNRMFGRDDSHLELLFEYGLGTGDGGVWRSGSATPPSRRPR